MDFKFYFSNILCPPSDTSLNRWNVWCFSLIQILYKRKTKKRRKVARIEIVFGLLFAHPEKICVFVFKNPKRSKNVILQNIQIGKSTIANIYIVYTNLYIEEYIIIYIFVHYVQFDMFTFYIFATKNIM